MIGKSARLELKEGERMRINAWTRITNQIRGRSSCHNNKTIDVIGIEHSLYKQRFIYKERLD